MSEFHFEEGELLLIDKPRDWTSFDVVAKVRNSIRIKKVGHAGTLDPMATGLLLLCTGKKTKSIESFMGMEKEYEGTLVFGATTPSYDAESEIDAEYPVEHLNKAVIEEALKGFTGWIEQVPPAYSAIKVKGKRAYELARKGKAPELEARRVEVSLFELTRVELPEVDFRVRCSKGTYIRSLAHDLGKAVNSGAYLTRLVRTRIGEYTLENAWQLPDLLEEIKRQKNTENEGLPES